MNSSTKKSPVMILIIMLISMVSGSTCMNKVAPVLGNITADLGITNSQAGILISIFVLSGIILSIPMGILTTKYGIFKTGLFSLVAILVGSALGAVVGSYIGMLFSRFVEGIGLMFLATIGPAAVSVSFSNAKRGTAMGILMCFMSFGQIIALNLAPLMAEAGNWRNFWWLTSGIAMVGLVLWVIFVKGIDESPSGAESGDNRAGLVLKDVLGNKSVWLICVTFLAYMLTHMGVFNYFPSYLTDIGNITPTQAGSLTSIASLIGIPVGILGGMLADKWGSRRKPLALTMVLLAVLVFVVPVFNSSTFFILMVLYGFFAMAEAGYCFTAVTEVVNPNQAGAASAVLNTAQWIGAFLGSTLFGTFLDSYGWNVSFYIMGAIALVGALAAIMNKKLK